MTKEIVYDLMLGKFRGLDTKNYNDDLTIGIIYLGIDSLELLKQYYVVCGYVLIDYRQMTIYPIDLQKKTIAIFEGTYNSFSGSFQKKLLKYIVQDCPTPLFTPFFLDWQFYMNLDCFIENGPLIKLSNYTLDSKKFLNKLIDAKLNLIESNDFGSLCEFVRKACYVYDFDISEENYYDDFKYLVDSLVNGYHINMTEFEIEKCFYQIRNAIIKKLEIKNV